MTTARRHDALITSATDEQLAAVAAIVGPHNVKCLVIADNGIPAFYHEGPRVMAQYADALPAAERARLKSWDELDEDTQDRVVGYATGCHEWIEEPPRLDAGYLADLLADALKFKAALLPPVAAGTGKRPMPPVR